MQISPHRVFCCPVPVNESNFKLAACPVTVNESDFELSSFPVLVNELHFELFACPVLIREFAYRLSARSVATRENIDGLPIFPALVLESVHALSVSFASVFPMSQSRFWSAVESRTGALLLLYLLPLGGFLPCLLRTGGLLLCLLRRGGLLPNTFCWVLQIIDKRVSIQFGSRPPRFMGVFSTKEASQQVLVMEQEVKALLEKRAIEYVRTPTGKPGFTAGIS